VCVPNSGDPVVCDPETEICTDLECTEATGICDPVPVNEGEVCGEDGNLCIPDLCDDTGVCVPNNGTPVVCEDGLCDECIEGTGECEPIPEEDAPDECYGEEICRTPGFWGARGGVEKAPKSQNITQAVIDSVGGLLVCGMPITNTDTGNNESAIEAICINGGDPLAKLIRHMTSSALNCALGECSADTAGLLAYCNDACAFGDEDDYGWCSDSLDCFNNGGHINADFTCVPVGTGECTSGDWCNVDGEACADESDCVPLYESCHDRDLCAEGDLECTFDPPGPASSSKKCNTASKDGIYIFEYDAPDPE
jgi:hypothetical protein